MILVLLVYVLFLVPSLLICMALDKRGWMPWNPRNGWEDLLFFLSVWVISPIAITLSILAILWGWVKDKFK